MPVMLIIFLWCSVGYVFGGSSLKDICLACRVGESNLNDAESWTNSGYDTKLHGTEANILVESGSLIVKFDLLLDEQITEDDPRIKSISYSILMNPGSTVKIYYQNDNAKFLSNTLLKMFHDQGIIAVDKGQTPLIHDKKNVWVCIQYAHHL
ncbi:MAG: hypothetical protein KBD37_03105 [Burkholderiales bacterium]|nr:hypothetical protein [Burkholderiales bacterium]